MKLQHRRRATNAARRDRISPMTVKRLSFYLRHLEDLAQQGQPTVSSRQLGKALGLTDTQVRKDLGAFGQLGRPGVGYKVGDLVARLRRVFGTEKTWNVAVVGAGSLGRALLGFKGFLKRGFRLAAAFDNDPAKIGMEFGGVRVRPMTELTSTIRKRRIRLAAITVPAEAAQQVADDLRKAGVKGILNFAPIRVNLPESVTCVPADLAALLQQLSYAVNTPRRGAPRPDPGRQS